MRVIIVLENFVYDEHIALPIIKRVFEDLEIPAKISVCKYPFLGGIAQALNLDQWDKIIEANPMAHLFILIVDRDGNRTRHQILNNIEKHAASRGKKLIATLAIEEFETWLLAGLPLQNNARWRDIREDISVKENHFYPFSESRDFLKQPDQGRKTLMREAMPNYSRIETMCGEIIALKERIRLCFIP